MPTNLMPCLILFLSISFQLAHSSSSSICQKIADKIPKFEVQPDPYCSANVKSRFSTSCATFYRSTAVLWEVKDSTSGVKVNSKSVEKNNATFSSITLWCDDAEKCHFKLSCLLLVGDDGEKELVRSRTTDVRFGYLCDLDANKNHRQINGPFPRSLVISTLPTQNVVLPCMISSNSSFPKVNWLYNGSQLFANSQPPFESDGWRSLNRVVRNSIFLWSNLTILGVAKSHSGVYQCFTDDPYHFNTIRLIVNESFQSKDIYSYSPTFHNVTFTEPFKLKVQHRSANFFSKTLGMVWPDDLKASIAVVTQRVSVEDKSPTYFDCLAGNPMKGASVTIFDLGMVSQYGQNREDEIKLNDSYYSVFHTCREFYQTAIFIRYSSAKMEIAINSEPFWLNMALRWEIEVGEFNNVTFDLDRSDDFICLSDGRLGINTHSNVMVPPFHLPNPVDVYQSANCDCMEMDGTYIGTVEFIPARIGDNLSRNVTYCLQTGGECRKYTVPSPMSQIGKRDKQKMTWIGSTMLSAKIVGNEISVSWYLPECRSLKAEFMLLLECEGNYSMTFSAFACKGKHNFPAAQNIGRLCSVKLVFPTFRVYEMIYIPPVLEIRNFSAASVGKELILSWQIDGFPADRSAESKVVEIIYHVYACLPSSLNDVNLKTTKNQFELECLGCRVVHYFADSVIIPGDVIHMGLGDLDPYVTKFTFVLWADIAFRKDFYDPLGVLGWVQTSLEGNPSATLSVQMLNHRGDWKLEWQTPSEPEWYFTLEKYYVSVTATSRPNAVPLLETVIPANDNNFLLTKAGLFLSKISYPSDYYTATTTFCYDNEDSNLYTVQIHPVWGYVSENKSAIILGPPISSIFRSQIGTSLDMQQFFNYSAFEDQPASSLSARIPFAVLISSIVFFVFLGFAMFVIYRCQLRKHKLLLTEGLSTDGESISPTFSLPSKNRKSMYSDDEDDKSRQVPLIEQTDFRRHLTIQYP